MSMFGSASTKIDFERIDCVKLLRNLLTF